MPLDSKKALGYIATLARNNDLRVTIDESVKGAVTVGISALIGGLLLGPRGLAVGGIIGGLGAAGAAEGKFKSVAEVIMDDMTPAQREELLNSVSAGLRSLKLVDTVILASLALMQEPRAQKAILGAVINYITDNMRLKIVQKE